MRSRAPQSATSLRRAPRDDANARMTKYFVMMSVRVVCFVLMVVITPYGWHTGVLAVGAILLPYLAVVVANVSSASHEATAVTPERAITAAPAEAPPPQTPGVIRVRESGTDTRESGADTPADDS